MARCVTLFVRSAVISSPPTARSARSASTCGVQTGAHVSTNSHCGARRGWRDAASVGETQTRPHRGPISVVLAEGEKNFFSKSSHAMLQLNLVNGRVLNQVI